MWLSLLAACGYHTPGKDDDWIGGDGETLYVELCANRTKEPYLENFLTEEVVFQLSRSRIVELTEQSADADLVMQCTIEDFEANARSYDPDDRITEYDAYIKAFIRLIRTEDGAVLWQERLTRTHPYPATVDKTLQLEGQEVAAREISKRLSENIYARMFNSF